MMACFFAFAFTSGARLPKSTSRRENRFEFKTPPRFAANGCDSAKGIPESDGASLVSLFSPGTAGMVADLIKEIARSGPRDTLRRSRSSVNTLCKLRRGFAGTGRLVAAPGREGPEKLDDLDRRGFGGVMATGPPNLRLIAAQRSGSREAKLQTLEARHGEGKAIYVQGSNNFDTEIPEYVVSVSHRPW